MLSRQLKSTGMFRMQRLKILVIGQCTLHWGRMEYGNIGNYYIVEPFVRELHRVFPNSEIRTTFQMSQEFCQRENVIALPIEYYYSWNPGDLETALLELSIAELYHKTGHLVKATPYINEVLDSDIVIDFSGDIWGDNADILGEDRFLIGLCKDRVAQLLGKPTVMLTGSPGPFKNQKTETFAKEVFSNFSFVTNREPISTRVLEEEGFDISKVVNLACPAFLFEPAKPEKLKALFADRRLNDNGRPTLGFILCGWNFTEGPFDKHPRNDNEYIQFAEAVEYISENLGAKVVLMSHSNGFKVPPAKFELIHGRDYPIIKQLQKVLDERGIARNVVSIDGIYDPWTTKAIIGSFDMMVSGRVHGAVAGLSQCVPTVMIDYGHEPKAHKIRGFAEVAGVGEYVADPSSPEDLIKKIQLCWNNRHKYREHLLKWIPEVKIMAKQNFELLQNITGSEKTV